ncbi:hypothetical protein AGMMS49983_17520 [Clostridia bacterium]|nr:hypothetical protein AGMMS49983_17520 [Clostridia bacterium]
MIVPEIKLHKRVVLLWRIYGVIAALAVGGVFFVITGVIYGLGMMQGFFSLVIVAIAVAATVVFAVVIFPTLLYERFRYHISDDEIILKKGIVIVVHTVIPMIKIQYTDTLHGPLMRALKLSAVRIMTAGGKVEIPGLRPEEAEQMSERITELVKIVRENV